MPDSLRGGEETSNLGLAAPAGWRLIEEELPIDQVLIWVEGIYEVAVHVPAAEGAPDFFMDARSDRVLPWPHYWMPLPQGPR